MNIRPEPKLKDESYVSVDHPTQRASSGSSAHGMKSRQLRKLWRKMF